MQIIITLFVVIGIVYVLTLIKKGRLELKYALSWIAVAVAVIILDWLPDLITDMADFFGVASPMNMMFFMGFAFLLVIMLTLTVAVSIAAGSVKRLTQKIALLSKRIEELENKEKENREK
jgi:hypothetical protein